MARLVWLLAVLLPLALPGTAVADNCSGPADCLRTAGYTAGLGVVSGVIAVGATIWVVTQTTSPTTGEVSEGRELAYFLEVNSHELAVTPGQPVDLTITPYQVLPGGGSIVAGDVAIGFQIPSGLEVAPSVGLGQVTARIDARPDLDDGAYSLQVTGTVLGATMIDTVTVHVAGGEYDLDFF